LPWRFPSRNRLVAAIAHAVVVVEAPERSGALITARCAAEYATEVMVLPGPADSERYRGSLGLLRDGARLIRDATDLLEDLDWDRTAREPPGREAAPPLSQTEAAVLDALAGAPEAADDIAGRLALPIAAVMAALTGLQLKGLAGRQPGPTYHRQS
jgi:DNA processing protein